MSRTTKQHYNYCRASLKFMREIFKLQVCYSIRLISEKPTLTLTRIVNDYLCIKKLLSGSDSEWSSNKKAFIILLDKWPKLNCEDIERIALHYFKKQISVKWRKDMSLVAVHYSKGQAAYDCFRYHIVGNEIELHYRNTRLGESTNRNIVLIGIALLHMLEHVHVEHPHIVKVVGESWMNSFAPILRLFPCEWQMSAVPVQLNGSNAWWGQFRNSMGGFNNKLGQRLRDTGNFPFKNLRCTCAIETIITHLRHLLSDQVSRKQLRS